MTVETTTSQAGIVDLSAMPRSRSLGAEAAGRLFKNRAAVFGMIVIAFFLFLAIFAPVIAPHDPLQITSGNKYLPPAWVEEAQTGKSGKPEYILGTDTLGRDVLSRVIY